MENIKEMFFYYIWIKYLIMINNLFSRTNIKNIKFYDEN
jgi:hypothetical protein